MQKANSSHSNQTLSPLRGHAPTGTDRGGRLAIVTSPERIPEALHGMAGTRITPAAEPAGLPRRAA
jgi:hypothetical protein